MATGEKATTLFKEADSDRYILTAEAEVALGAAWRVLQAFDRAKCGRLDFYNEDRRDNTLDYLRSGGEERPYSGIFAVEMRESWDIADRLDLMVSNRNGHGNEDYRAILRSAVSIVGIEGETSDPESTITPDLQETDFDPLLDPNDPDYGYWKAIHDANPDGWIN